MPAHAHNPQVRARFKRASSAEDRGEPGEDSRFDESVIEHIGHVFESIGTDLFYPSLIGLLRTAAQFDDVTVLQYKAGRPPSAPYTELSESPPETLIMYVKGLYMQSPFYEMSAKGQSGFGVLSEIAPEEFFETELYKYCMSQAKLVDEAVFVVQGREGLSHHLSLSRTVKLSEYSPAESEALARMAPIVEQAVLRHEHLCQGKAGVEASETSVHLKLSDITPELLTDREREVVGYLVRGYSSKACARQLDISPATERVHRKKIYEKLGVNSQSELLASVFESLLAPPGG